MTAATGTAAPDATGDAASGAAPTSLFSAALTRLPTVKDAEGNILTDPFLETCELILPLFDSFGSAFTIVRSDISGNIERLRARKLLDPERFSKLYAIVEDEVARNDYQGGGSCTKGLLWLKRAMEFMVALMQGLIDQPDASLSSVVYDKYYATLNRWHGFFASSAFKVAFAFLPNRDALLDRVAGGKFTAETDSDMHAFAQKFSALLSEVHRFMDERGLDDPYKV